MTTPTVLGLDLSLTATGIAWPDGQLETVRTLPRDGDSRLVQIEDVVLAGLLIQHRPDLAVIEDLPIHASAAGKTGMVHGVIRAKLLRHGIPYLLVSPATLKVYAAGRGTCDKSDMRMSLYQRAGLDVADDNQVDAAWCRYLGLDMLGSPAIQLPQTHKRALAKLTLPEQEAA
jgi:Holliday junction resolvasome RuvABC endonuclease subunit